MTCRLTYNRILYSSGAEQTTSPNSMDETLKRDTDWEAGHKCAHRKPGMRKETKEIQAQ